MCEIDGMQLEEDTVFLRSLYSVSQVAVICGRHIQKFPVGQSATSKEGLGDIVF